MGGYPPSDKFDAQNSLDKQTIENLRKWGFNVVRLGVMWPGVEPEKGQIDSDYLSAVAKLSLSLAEEGVYTLADLHQDVGSRHFCGEGFPEHYVEALLADPDSQLSRVASFPAPLGSIAKNGSGFPELDACLKRQFSNFYSTYQVGALWSELYRNGSDLRQGFRKFWAAVAETFKDSPQLLAYELLNEPSGTCLDSSTALECRSSGDQVPLRFDNRVEAEKLTPLYREAASEIRRVGATQVILYEPTVWPKLISSVFPKPALGDDTQQGLAYHIYCEKGDGDSYISGVLCDAAQEVFEDSYYPFLKAHRGIGGFMTEFGAVGGNAGELHHLDNLLAKSDEHFQSWTYWQLKLYKDFTTANSAESLYAEDGSLEVHKLKTLSRAYAPAIAGVPILMTFDPASKLFKLDFNATIAAETELYLNEELHYPEGYQLDITPEGCLDVEKDLNRVYLRMAPDSSCLAKIVQVRISQSRAAEEIVI